MRRYKKANKNDDEHRVIAAKILGRPLTRKEVVHHKNGDGRDNRPENLEVMTCQKHCELHNQKHPRIKTCETCGKEYEPHPTKRARSKTCSRPCFKALASKNAIRLAASPGHSEKLRAAAFRNGSAERGKTLVLHRWHPELVSDPPQPAEALGRELARVLR